MTEITTKLPYVAGYNVKMAFVIQDLKNLDEIYGETSRHSLMGNCGYQLVLGANDQVTAESVSKALGKRTIRYKTESRTIELMGLHRRTKVEQLRERDLMMPQEVRQMPREKMIIFAEGQGPIFADKLRFFQTMPFREMEEFSRAHLPEVPATEFLPQRPVPATTPGYTGEVEGSEPSGEAPALSETRKGPPRRLQTDPGLRSRAVPRQISARAGNEARSAVVSSAPPSTIEDRFVPAARRLGALIQAQAKSARAGSKDVDWSRIFEETIPDQHEIAELTAS